MPSKDETDALAAINAWLDDSLKGYGWLVEAGEKMVEIEGLRRGIIGSIRAILPKGDSAFSYDFETSQDISFLQSASQPIIDACKLLARPTDAGYSYRIELRGEFIYEMHNEKGEILSETHEGLFLTLVSPEKKVAGILGIRVGLPFEVWVAQGDNFGECQNFFKASNGQTFDIALLKHFINCVGSAVHFPKEHPLRNIPKGEFRILEDYKLKEGTLKRLSQFAHPRDRARFVNGHPELGTFMNLKAHTPIDDRHFRRASHVRQQAIRQ